MNSYPDHIAHLAAESSAACITSPHLTLDQIDDHLIGDLAPAPAAHLAACTLCTERVAAARTPIASFQHVSTAWSERRSATLPIPVATAQRPVWQRHMAWATASLSLAFGIAFINASHQFSALSAAQPAPVSSSVAQLAPVQPAALKATAFTQTASLAPLPRARQISADNHILRAIDASLDPATDSPAALGLAPAAAISNGPPASLQD